MAAETSDILFRIKEGKFKNWQIEKPKYFTKIKSETEQDTIMAIVCAILSVCNDKHRAGTGNLPNSMEIYGTSDEGKQWVITCYGLSRLTSDDMNKMKDDMPKQAKTPYIDSDIRSIACYKNGVHYYVGAMVVLVDKEDQIDDGTQEQDTSDTEEEHILYTTEQADRFKHRKRSRRIDAKHTKGISKLSTYRTGKTRHVKMRHRDQNGQRGWFARIADNLLGIDYDKEVNRGNN